MIKTLIGVIVVAIAVIAVFMFIDPNINATAIQTSSLTIVGNSSTLSIEEGYFSVTVEGEIAKPGSYVVSEEATMGDLIEAAGGTTEYADDLAYFLDAELEKGMTYYIAPKFDTSNVCTLTDITKVNINTASLDEFLTINVFTSSIANSIISYRAEKGDFRTLESVLDVYGIGNATYQKIRKYITLHA